MSNLEDFEDIDILAADTCDKCGEAVDLDNNAVLLDVVLGLATPLLMIHTARHLLPVADCPGSPSRAQYLEGQPRDTRAAYPLEKRAIDPIRAAYAAMLDFAKEHTA